MKYIVKAVYKTGMYKDQAFLISKHGRMIEPGSITSDDLFIKRESAKSAAERWQQRNEEARGKFNYVDRLEVSAIPYRGRVKRNAKVKTKAGR